MQVKNTRALFIVEVFLINLTVLYGAPGGNNPKPDNGSTWFEAQRNCSGRGLRLSTEARLDKKDHWTGRYKRLSDWIKIKGCYPDFNFKNYIYGIQKEMPTKSVGACQEMCKYENVTTFAVQSNRCICLKGKVSFEAMSLLLPSKCNFTCDNEDGIYSEDCGGEDAYNIYISDQKYTSVNNEQCMVLQCSTADPRYMIRNCSKYFEIMCKNPNASFIKNANWTYAMKSCKISNFSSYLYGDLDLTNANGSCLSLPEGNADVRWIGIARQIYENEDQGWTIEEREESQFQSCQKCSNNGKCFYVSCGNMVENGVFCSNRSTEISGTTDITTTDISTRQSLNSEKTAMVNITTEKQTSTKLTTSIPTKTSEQLNQHVTTNGENLNASKQQETTVEINTAIISNSQQPEGNRNATYLTDEDDNVGSLIPIILGVVVPVVAIILLGIYIRRRNNVKNSKGRNKPPERKKAKKTDINNPSYFVLEKPSSYELADESVLVSESPYNETEEGEYDHLRNKDSRKKDEDDTYQHATSISNGDVSHYDYTTTHQRERNEKIEKSKKIISPELREDSTYTEVDTAPPNTYFVLEKPSPYDLAANSTLDCDSPYNETEEGEYDHLRKKESRKKIVDDTYQHATPVINVDASVGHYDTAIADKNQEVESNYDHMHESLNFNRNSENGYNYTT